VVLILAGGGDSFDCYTVASPAGVLNGGNLPSEWTGVQRTLGLQWFDPLDTYTVENPVTQTLDDGTAFWAAVPSGNWHT
jgi:hypothetical protein